MQNFPLDSPIILCFSLAALCFTTSSFATMSLHLEQAAACRTFVILLESSLRIHVRELVFSSHHSLPIMCLAQ
ncbi:hypothetical protein V8C37DRAFT_393323 [Trichoderma ceciliae]